MQCVFAVYPEQVRPKNDAREITDVRAAVKSHRAIAARPPTAGKEARPTTVNAWEHKTDRETYKDYSAQGAQKVF